LDFINDTSRLTKSSVTTYDTHTLLENVSIAELLQNEQHGQLHPIPKLAYASWQISA